MTPLERDKTTINICKEKLPVKPFFNFFWWRRWESNPRPKKGNQNFYIHSPSFNLAPALTEGQVRTAASSSCFARDPWARVPDYPILTTPLFGPMGRTEGNVATSFKRPMLTNNRLHLYLWARFLRGSGTSVCSPAFHIPVEADRPRNWTTAVSSSLIAVDCC